MNTKFQRKVLMIYDIEIDIINLQKSALGLPMNHTQNMSNWLLGRSLMVDAIGLLKDLLCGDCKFSVKNQEISVSASVIT